MLRLKHATDPRWADLVEKDIEEVLTDHAYCEQKAASTAISLIVKFPEFPELVQEMSALAQEEMEHFSRVHEIIIKRGFKLGQERKDEYVNELLGFLKKGNSKAGQLVEKLLFAAMIEARSCERFRVLSEHIEDTELALFYKELMASEAGHHTMFLKLARKFGIPAGIDVDARWNEFLEFEAGMIENYEQRARIHG
ncbi:MAG: tRNA-(ms[2]io[6]A)-hydroxylase [Bacteroidia bacterium]|jgi:tRNA-(ms[2]io[6]A)-hydroxylase